MMRQSWEMMMMMMNGDDDEKWLSKTSLEIRTRKLRPPVGPRPGSLRSHSLGTAPGLCPVPAPRARECATPRADGLVHVE